MSVPLLIALESTPLLAPIVLSMAPIVIPSLEAISCILDKILPIIENFENYHYICSVFKM